MKTEGKDTTTLVCLPLLIWGRRIVPRWLFGCEGLSPMSCILTLFVSIWCPRCSPFLRSLSLASGVLSFPRELGLASLSFGTTLSVSSPCSVAHCRILGSNLWVEINAPGWWSFVGLPPEGLGTETEKWKRPCSKQSPRRRTSWNNEKRNWTPSWILKY